MYIVLLGAPGSGKGTVGEIIAKDLKLAHISTGDLFRENLKNKTELGKKAQEYMDKGELVPDGDVMKFTMLYSILQKSKEFAINAVENYIKEKTKNQKLYKID